MLRWTIGLSLQYRVMVLIAAAALMAFGLSRFRDLPVSALPEFSPTVVEVQTEALGLSAIEIEDLVTVNMEELLAGTPWVKTIRSKSVPGLSSVLLVFEPGTDIMRARQVVSERLIGAHALPNVSKKPVMLQPLSTESRAMIIGLSSKDVPLIDMSVLARWTIVPKLIGVPGVANVTIWGQRARQLQVQVDPARLRESGVTLNQVVKTTGEALWVSPLSYLEASMPGAGGWIDTPNQRLGILHTQPITTAPDLAKVPVDGASVPLGEIARVVEDHPPLIGDAIVRGGPGLLLVVEQFPEANTQGVIRGVENAMRELSHGMPGIDVDTSIYQVNSFIVSASQNLTVAIVVGALLLVLALFLLHSDWRAAVISIAAIASSLVTAGLLLHLSNATLNAMILAGLVVALAVIVDDAVTDTEAVLGKLRQRSGDNDRPIPVILFEAFVETRSALIYATLILVLAVVPVFLIVGPLGAFLDPLAISYVLALAASTVVALTLTPALALVLLRRVPADRREAPLTRWLRPLYERTLARVAAAPRQACGIAAVAALAVLLVMPVLNWSLSPSFKERDVHITWQAGPGTSHPEMQRIIGQASGDLRQLPGIRSVAAHIGRAITGDQVVGIESGQIWVGLQPGAPYDETIAAIRESVQGYPGLNVQVQAYLTDKAKEVLTAGDDPVVVRVQGLERAVLRQQAERLKELLTGIPGLVNLRMPSEAMQPEVEIEVDLAAAGRVGLKPGDVRRAAATVFAGLEVGNLFEQQKVFDVVVWSTPENRRSVTNISELLIDTPAGGHVRLADVAKVRIAPGPAVIEREGISRFIDIHADVSGRDINAVRRDVEERLNKMTFPLEYHSVLLGDYSEHRAALWRIIVAALVAAAGVYLLLQVCFQSWSLAGLFGLPVLAALAGGVLAMIVTGGTVFLGSLAGFIAVLGFAARHGILLIHGVQHGEREGADPSGDPECVLRAARERLGPVVTSAVAIVAALLPMAVLGDVAGLEIVCRAAVVIIGGVVAAAVVTLLVIPALYLSFLIPRPAAQSFKSDPQAPVGAGAMEGVG